jgi:hypothetical protein
MLARTMWLEHGMRVSGRRERGAIGPDCNNLDFGEHRAGEFCCKLYNNDDSPQATLLGLAMFLRNVVARDTATFQIRARLVSRFISLSIACWKIRTPRRIDWSVNQMNHRGSARALCR